MGTLFQGAVGGIRSLSSCYSQFTEEIFWRSNRFSIASNEWISLKASYLLGVVHRDGGGDWTGVGVTLESCFSFLFSRFYAMNMLSIDNSSYMYHTNAESGVCYCPDGAQFCKQQTTAPKHFKDALC